MRPKNELYCHYDGVCIYATISVKPNIVAKIILSFINLFLLAAITTFIIEGVAIAAIAFSVLEFFTLKYTLWNFLGEERVIINTRSLSYQQHYGFFNTPLQTISLNKKILIRAYDQIIENELTLVKFLVESYNDQHLPEVIYHSVLNITEADFKRLLEQVDRLYIDEMSERHAMPEIILN